MRVLLVDLDDTLVPDEGARDQAMATTLARYGVSALPMDLWAAVREEWRASGVRSAPVLTGVSSWEALWTDFDAAVADPVTQVAGRAYQRGVWSRLLPGEDAAWVGATFRQAREDLVRPFDWVPATLAGWASQCDLWCVTNGSSWLQRRKFLLAGLQSTFSRVVISGELGAEKSDPRFHQQVAAQLSDTGSTATAVIGDSDTSDATLASALRVPFVRVRPGSDPSDEVSTHL